MVKQATIVVLGCGLALGACLCAPEAEAVSMKQLSTGVTVKFFASAAQPSAFVSFLLGEDGAIWYTSTQIGGQCQPPGACMPTGNSLNPFDQSSASGAPSSCINFLGCNGFVDASGLAAACGTTGDTCSGIYVKTPGPGSFQDSPTVQAGAPIARGIANIVATGLDNKFYYTLFDTDDTGTNASMGPFLSSAAIPSKDPFFMSREDGNTAGSPSNGRGTGFVNQPSLQAQCVLLSRTCVGIWARFP